MEQPTVRVPGDEQLNAIVGAARRRGVTDAVDVAVLNDAPPVVRYNLLRDGRRLYSDDEALGVDLETQALKAYFDWLPALRLHQRSLKARLRQGRFAHRR